MTQLGFQFRPDFTWTNSTNSYRGPKIKLQAIFFSKRSCAYFTILAKQPPNNERQTNMTIYLSKNQCFSPHESWKNIRNQLWANFKTACKKSFSCFKLQIVAVCNQSIAHVRRAGSEGKHSTRDVYLANKTAVLFVVNLCHEIILYEWLADSETRDNFLRLKCEGE